MLIKDKFKQNPSTDKLFINFSFYQVLTKWLENNRIDNVSK